MLAKGQWVSSGKCTGKYAISCVEALWKAAVPFVQALNKINNHDTITRCCNHLPKEGEGGDSSGIDLMTYIRVLQLAQDLGSADPVVSTDEHGPTDQDPDATPSDD